MNESIKPSSGASATKNSTDQILDEIERLDDKTLERFETLARLLRNTLEESHQKHETLAKTLTTHIQTSQAKQQEIEKKLDKIQEEASLQKTLTSLRNLMEYQSNLTSKACLSTQEMSTTSRKQMDDLFIQLMPMLAIPKQIKELQQLMTDDLASHSQGSKQYQTLTVQAKELLLNLQQSIQKIETYPIEVSKSLKSVQSEMTTHLDKSLDKITIQTDKVVTNMQASYRYQPVAMSKGTMWLWAAALALSFTMLGLLAANKIWSTEITQYEKTLNDARYFAQQLEQMKAKSQKK